MKRIFLLTLLVFLVACPSQRNTPPTLTLDALTQQPLTSLLELTGTVTDDREVSQVIASLGDDNFTATLANKKFTVTIPLRAGENAISIVATDNQAASSDAVTTTLYFGERLAAGGAHSGALKDGKLFTWGRSNLGQTGLGATSAMFLEDKTVNPKHPVTPTAAVTDVLFAAIYFNQNQSLAIGKDGKVYSWGDDAYGQLGRGDEGRADCGSRKANCRLDIAAIADFKDIVQIAVGYRHVLALDVTGKVYAFGRNNEGQLGNGTTDNSSAPVAVVWADEAPRIVQIIASSSSSYALDDKGQLWGWGRDRYANLGDGEASREGVSKPQKITIPEAITQVAVGRDHVLALSTTGKIYAWGLNRSSQVGYNGKDFADTDNAWGSPVVSPKALPSMEGVTVAAVYANGNTSYLRSSAGKLYAWGMYGLSEGTGTVYADLDKPTDVFTSLTGIEELAVGALHQVARNTTGAYFSWGWSFEGSLGGAADTIINRWMYNSPLTISLP